MRGATTGMENAMELQNACLIVATREMKRHLNCAEYPVGCKPDLNIVELWHSCCGATSGMQNRVRTAAFMFGSRKA